MTRHLFWAGLLGLLLTTLPATGAVETMFSVKGAIVHPTFSPDGTKIAFIEGTGTSAKLSQWDMTAKKLTVLVSEPGEKTSPSFLPDNQTLFFCWKKGTNFDVFTHHGTAAKTTQITTTPEDEFALECARNSFFDDFGKAEKWYYEVLFLRGQAGAGTLWRMDDSGGRQRSTLPRPLHHFAIGGQCSTLAVADAAGLQLVPFVYLSESGMEYATSVGEVTADPLYDIKTPGLGDPVFTPNYVDLYVRDTAGAVWLLRGGKGEKQPTALTSTTRVAVHPRGTHVGVVVQNGETSGFVLHPIVDRRLKISNLYKYVSWGQDGDALAQPASEALFKQNFVVVPNEHKTFYGAYEGLRYSVKESFITADSVYFLFHLFYDYLLKYIEQGVFLREVSAVTESMSKAARQAAEKARQPESKKRFRQWWAFFSLAQALSLPEKAQKDLLRALPADLKSMVEADLACIAAATDRTRSQITENEVDFSQFKVRGHYEGVPALEQYFRLMMLFSQFPLRVFTNDGGQSADIPLILGLHYLGINAKMKKGTAIDTLQRLSEPLNFLVGEMEDISVMDLPRLLNSAVTITSPDDIADPAKITAGWNALKAFPKPKLRPFAGVQVMFFPQRATFDSFIMQRLVSEAVGTPKNLRLLPNGLDITAALGSKRAEHLLKNVLNQTRFENYERNLREVTDQANSWQESDWQANAYRGWLKTFRDLLLLEGKNTEEFTKSDAWKDRILNTVLGSLTTLRHDTILYNKMGGAEAGEGGEEYMKVEIPDVYVDPYPKLYGNLRRLSLELYARLAAPGFLPAADKGMDSEEEWDRVAKLNAKGLCLELIGLLGFLESVALKQEQNIALTASEHKRLRKYGIELEHLSDALTRPQGPVEFPEKLEDVALIADVFNGDGTCLEMAIGRVFDLFVLHTRHGVERLYQGGVFSYYEFEQPAGNRLSDLDWRRMIYQNKAPDLPSWTSSFVVGKPPVIEANEWESERLGLSSPAPEGDNDSGQP